MKAKRMPKSNEAMSFPKIRRSYTALGVARGANASATGGGPTIGATMGDAINIQGVAGKHYKWEKRLLRAMPRALRDGALGTGARSGEAKRMPKSNEAMSFPKIKRSYTALGVAGGANASATEGGPTVGATMGDAINIQGVAGEHCKWEKRLLRAMPRALRDGALGTGARSGEVLLG
ncbi:unnamed protein product [Ilex paraguariensis]|uniref:Uncharacterized protein n=1 Tax=Ilex paraguariensis TaxID=185542 RepID=A0ABC8T1F7_9AQUA